MKNKLTITTIETTEYGIRYCEIRGARWFNRCSLPANHKLSSGDIFNVYRREYVSDENGEIKQWLCDKKYGCEFDGRSVATSLERLDLIIEQDKSLRSTTINSYPFTTEYLQPLN